MVERELVELTERQERLLAIIKPILKKRGFLSAGDIRKLIKENYPEMYGWYPQIRFYSPELENDLDQLVSGRYLKRYWTYVESEIFSGRGFKKQCYELGTKAKMLEKSRFGENDRDEAV